MELVGYWTSHKEIWDIYHSVYLLRRSPGLPPCGAQWSRRVISNILSSLTSQLHRWGYPAITREGQDSKNEWLPRLSRRESYEEALKVACQRVLKTAAVLRSDIERLSWGMRDIPWICSRSWSRSKSHSRSCGKGHRQSHPWSCSWSIWLRSPIGSQSRRKVLGARGQARPQKGGRGLPAGAFHLRCQNMARSAGWPTKYTLLVVGTPSHSRGKGPGKTGPQDLGLLFNSQSKEQDLPGATLHCTSSP